ncbi:K+-transporting ATPase ATPase C chain [Arcanobacterium pluranimalium]|uniref:potassium-transporting ATPase subunit C n=1 Tax=Arcanobacterium pluranimalium TaxID=108028 RepID=UPI0019587BCE|nr:potassium-transporting ATPase subunit C [Arcanobacterium pluranimalium]MBM7824314.1 K+-transporting ATPase ATPase C chain [Arcanobacterium pluranimalium]
MSLSRMKRVALTATKMFIAFTVLLGVIYPLVFVGVAQVFADKAQGSLLTRNADAQVVGSTLLAQPVSKPGYFYYRPSHAGDGWDPMQSGSSNLSPGSTELRDMLAQRRRDIAQREQVREESVPVDAVTASGSGLDPHISLNYARLQVARVALERKMTREKLEQIVNSQVERVFNGYADGQIVNVTTLNYALDMVAGSGKE